MLFYPSERLALFVDGSNLYGAVKGLGFDMDYSKLFALFSKKGILVRAHYYTAIADTAAEERNPLRPLVDWLEFNGWTITTKIFHEGRPKCSINVDLAVDALEMATHADHIVIVSGDGDLHGLVESLQRRGRRVSIVSTIETSPPVCSEDLRRIADNFIDLHDIEEIVKRDGAPKVLKMEHAS